MITHETVASPALRRLSIRGFFKNILYWIFDLDDEITLEEGRRRMRSSPGFFASLTPEQLEMMRNYDGPESLSPPLTRRNRRFLLEERPPSA